MQWESGTSTTRPLPSHGASHHTWVTVATGIAPPLPAAPSAAGAALLLAAWAREACTELADTQAQLGQKKGQQPCRDLSGTHRGLSVRNSETALERDQVLALSSAKSQRSFKPAAHCGTTILWHVSCRNALRKSCIFPHAGGYGTLPNPFTFHIQGKPQRRPVEIHI